ncbi:MAG: hypothetical protein Q9162_003494 [Coniocarpon cinnabarinum]
MVAVQPIKSQSDYDALQTPSPHLQVLYFHAPWAEPCKQMSTVLEHLASTYEPDQQVSFHSVDAEELPEIAEEHDVEAVPFIALKKDSKIIDSISGGDAAKVRTVVEKHANPASDLRSAIPPQQTVTRPPPPEPKENPTVTNGIQAAATSAQSTSGAQPPAKNLSSYAPTSSDPPTAPAMSSAATNPSTQTQEDLNARLTDLVKAAPVMLFMKGTPSAPQCGFSRQLVSILRENNVRYGFFNILADDDVRQGLKTFSDWPTFPQLYMSGELVGGLDIVKEEIENDKAFFGEYRVSSGRNEGGPASAEAQKAPAVSA